MRVTSLTALGIAALTALTTTAATAATGATGATPSEDAPATKPARTASVHGSARIHYVFSPDDDIRFTIDAEAAPYSRPLPGLPQGLPTDARGTVSLSHVVAATGHIATAKARVDCLVTGGGTATLTAVVTRSDVGPVGERLGFSVGEGRAGEPDRLGFSWGVANVDPEKADEQGNVTAPRVGTCMAPAPFAPTTRAASTSAMPDFPCSPPIFADPAPAGCAKIQRMPVRYPRPLRPGDRIGVTSPSSGVPRELRERLAVAVRDVEARGYEVVTGRCMDGSGHVSAPAADRAAELSAMLTDPGIRAVVPPWGGETAIDLLPLIDWEAVRAAEPTWVVGYSDMSTVMTPLTLLTGVATVHGNNLMDTPYRVPEGLVSWFDVVTAPPGHRFTQIPPERHRASGWDDWAAHPEVRTLTLDIPGRWTRLGGGGDVDVEGRLIGGCVEMLCNLTGTPYLDTSAFARTHAPEGLLVYVEAAGDDALAICRYLHGMRLAGFFDAANAVLVGRTAAPDTASLTQHQAVMDALGPLNVPIVADVECGHVPPYLPLVNGARCRVVHTATRSEVTQTLG